jgi:PhzF family phenazine biosynthesis protein
MTSMLLQVDAFTDRPFGGNPAAVCLLGAAADAGWMQDVAAEMNLSETAFLVRRDGGFDLRWFTPMVEVPLCGHATLASAHALWSTGQVAHDATIRFFTASGELRASREDGLIWLDLPAREVTPAPLSDAARRALGVAPVWEGRAGGDLLVELATEEEVRTLAPDMALLREVAPDGVIVTSAGRGQGVDFVSRYFAPSVGIDEDPVTGSAHCALATYWAAKLSKSSFRALQVSARGGDLRVRVAGQRVLIGGTAVTILRGELT